MTAPDFNSPMWAYTKERLEGRIADLRKQNDSLGLDAVATAILRGRIAEAQDLLSLPEKISRDKTLQEQARR